MNTVSEAVCPPWLKGHRGHVCRGVCLQVGRGRVAWVGVGGHGDLITHTHTLSTQSEEAGGKKAGWLHLETETHTQPHTRRALTDRRQKGGNRRFHSAEVIFNRTTRNRKGGSTEFPCFGNACFWGRIVFASKPHCDTFIYWRCS